MDGEFIYRRPTIAERGQIEGMRVTLNRDLITIDPDISDLHVALSHLRYTLKEYPDWWKETDFGGSLYDTNVVMDIYDECIKFERKWQSKVTSGKPEDVKEEEGNEPKPRFTRRARPSGDTEGAEAK